MKVCFLISKNEDSKFFPGWRGRYICTLTVITVNTCHDSSTLWCRKLGPVPVIAIIWTELGVLWKLLASDLRNKFSVYDFRKVFTMAYSLHLQHFSTRQCIGAPSSYWAIAMWDPRLHCTGPTAALTIVVVYLRNVILHVFLGSCKG